MLCIKRTLISLALIAGGASASAIAQDVAQAKPGAVIATQGGVSVTFADLDAFAEHIPPAQRPGFFNSPTRIEGVITNLLMQKQLAAEARKAGLDRDPDVTSGSSPATDETLAKLRMEHFRAEVKVPDMSELAKEKYQASTENYLKVGMLTVKDVMISTQSRSPEEAKVIADAVEKEAVAHPEQFDALIEKYSDDPGKSTSQGLLENVGERGKYAPEFAEAAKALTKPGDISPVVSTPADLHVMKLIERTPDLQSSFDEVKDAIVAQLKAEFVDKAVREHTDELRNLAMNADPALVASLRDRYGKVAPIPGAESKPTPLK